MSSSNKYAIELMKDLPEMFEYSALKDKINEALNEGVIGEEKRIMLEDLQWLVDSFILWNSNTITILLNVLYSQCQILKVVV
jgi:hypothetical protein